ncbi:MAG: potassium efflux system protein, partial [Planctomycetota bacterium]
AKRRVDVAGLTDAVGILLRKHKTDLPRVRDLKRRAVERKDNFATLQLARIDLEDLEERLKTEADIVATALENVAEADKARAKDEARDLFRSHRRVAALVIQDVDRQFRQLLDLEQTELQLLSTSSEFGGYINERILWVRSGKPLWSADLVDSKKGIAWLLNPPNWQAAGSTLWRDARRSPIWYLLAAALLGGLVSMRRLLRRRLLSAGEEAAIRSCRSLGPTIKALGFTLLLLAPGPLIVWLLGWRLSVPLDAPAFSKALGFGLRSSTLPILLVEIVRKTCRSGGLGQKHFEWPSDQLQRIRRRLLLLTGTAVPLYFVVSVFEAHDEAGWKQSLGGIALVVSLVALALLLHNVLFKTSGQQTRAQAIARASVCVLPLVLALLAVSGFIFTSLELTRRLLMSFGLGVAATLVYAVVRRWLLVTRSRIRRDQALARRKKSKEQDADEPEIPVEEEKVDLEMATLQSRLLLRNVLVFATLLGAWLVWVDVLPALRVFDQVKLWPTTFTQIENVVGDEGVMEAVTSTTLRYITLGNAFFALLVLAATYYGTKNIPSILEVSILQRLSLGAGERYAVATLTRYAITLTGVVTALGVIGIGWAKVQWLAAAVTVGLGFGLQEIFGNFVSGLIILFERPIRVGDYVTVGDTDGRVTKIRMRATTITDWDLREMIVPNKEFITSRIVNWTLSNPITRIVFPVGVAYGSDTDLARKLLLEIAQQDPLVLNDPGPSAVFVKFGDSVLEIHLRVFLENRDNWPELVTRINTRIHEGFAEAAIEIAFPQRDLHLRSIGPLADVLSKHPGLVVEEVGAEPREVT